MPTETPRLTCPQLDPAHLHLSSSTPLGVGAISQVAFSRVFPSGYKQHHTPVAVKIVSKIQALQQHKVQSLMDEKEALLRLAPHPFIARLFWTAQSEDELYFVMEWLPHGDLLQHIRRCAVQCVQDYHQCPHEISSKVSPPTASHTTTTTSTVKTLSLSSPDVVPLTAIPYHSTAVRCLEFSDIQLITAQLVLALGRVFEKGLVLRDFKPENIVFDDHYRACLIDFDTVDLTGGEPFAAVNPDLSVKSEQKKVPASCSSTEDASTTAPPPPRRRLTVSEIQQMRVRTSSFCGTAQYVSPEMVGACRWNYSSDLWALGATVYELLYGEHMFRGDFTYTVLKQIMEGNKDAIPYPRIDFLTGKEPATAFERVKDFIQRLVHRDPRQRLGVHPLTGRFDLSALRSHPFFADFEWHRLEVQLQSYRPHDCCHPPPSVRRRPTGASSSSLSSSEDETEKRTLEREEAVEVRPEAYAYGLYEDGTTSLEGLYHRTPYNDPAYSDYVYQVSADANPFERAILRAVNGEEERVEAGIDESASSALQDGIQTTSRDPQKSLASSSSSTRSPFLDPEDAEEEDDVIDDVGIRFCGTADGAALGVFSGSDV